MDLYMLQRLVSGSRSKQGPIQFNELIITQAAGISLCHILSLIEIGLRRQRHFSQAGHTLTQRWAAVGLMQAEVQTEIVSVQWVTVIGYPNDAYCSLLDHNCVNISCIMFNRLTYNWQPQLRPRFCFGSSLLYCGCVKLL